MNHSERLRADYQYLVGVGPEARRASATDLADAWLSLVDRAHDDLQDGELR